MQEHDQPLINGGNLVGWVTKNFFAWLIADQKNYLAALIFIKFLYNKRGFYRMTEGVESGS